MNDLLKNIVKHVTFLNRTSMRFKVNIAYRLTEKFHRLENKENNMRLSQDK